MAHSNRAQVWIAAQQYPWWQMVDERGNDWNTMLPNVLGQVVQAGVAGWEPSFQSAAEVEPLVAMLQTHALTMRSCYAGGEFHTSRADETIARIEAIGAAVQHYGVEVMVINPDPIRWGGTENKTDEQLHVQAQALEELGRRLAHMGVRQAYHTHDAEMRAAARELHHMLVGTGPEYVGFCLDTHWIYRGAENSMVALLDIAKLYAERIALLHLRQSQNGVWSETCESGDIDYVQLAALLQERGIHPLLVLEQAREAGTPSTLEPMNALARSRRFIEQVFESPNAALAAQYTTTQ